MRRKAAGGEGVAPFLLVLLLSLHVLRTTEASEVVTLTDENFQEQIESDDTWLVDFYGKCVDSFSGDWVMVG